MFRSSRAEVFCKNGILRNIAKFTGKHLCQSFFFNKVAGFRFATSLKKRLWHRRFPVNFAKFLMTSFLKEHLWWLLLNISTELLIGLPKFSWEKLENLHEMESTHHTNPINWNFNCKSECSFRVIFV